VNPGSQKLVDAIVKPWFALFAVNGYLGWWARLFAAVIGATICSYNISLSLVTILFLLFIRRMVYPPDYDLYPYKSFEDAQSIRSKAGTDKITEDKTFTTRDGVKIHYTRSGFGKHTLVLANGIGCGSQFWFPILKWFIKHGKGADITSITWDYRGLFRSGTPKNTAFLTMRDHASDCVELLDELGVEQVHTFIGWSTGVQVGLELATLYPDRVKKLVFLNGAHGNTLHSVFQPVLRVPYTAEFWHYVILTVLENYEWMGPALAWVTINFRHVIRWLLIKPLDWLMGTPYDW
jgi:hypothetical protein